MKAAERSLRIMPDRSLTPIIKVVGDFCNLRCSYCFYSRKDQSQRKVMPDEVLHSFIRQQPEISEAS